MNFELKKVTWQENNQPDVAQIVSLSYRKQSAADVPESYTDVTDSLYVLPNGTVVNPPLIKGLESATAYVFRLTHSNGAVLDVAYITPEELVFNKIRDKYVTNSRIEVSMKEVSSLKNIKLTYSIYAFYTLENDFRDLVGNKQNMVANGPVVPKKADLFTGIYIDSQTGSLVAPDLNMYNMFSGKNGGSYGWGVEFYVASGDLPDTGIWPLLSCIDSNGYGVIVYVDNATKQVVWQQKNASLTESVRTPGTILMDSWNKLLLGNYTLQLSEERRATLYLNEEGDDIVMSGASIQYASPNGAPPLYVGHVDSDMEVAGKGIFRNVYMDNPIDYYNGGNVTEGNFVGYLQRTRDDQDITTFPLDSLVYYSNDKLAFTIPADVNAGAYYFYAEFAGNKTSPVYCEVTRIGRATVGFNIPLTVNEVNLHNFSFESWFYGLDANYKNGTDGGVQHRNIYFKDGLLVMDAHGDWYDGYVQGIAPGGDPKEHTAINDPLVGEKWRTRVGAAVTSKLYCGYGSYKVEAKLPKEPGASPFFKLYYHADVEAPDPFYEECLANGLHKQGSTLEDEGFYIKVRNEISMELPANDSVAAFNLLSDLLQANYSSPYAGMKVAVAGDQYDVRGTWQLNNPAAPQLAASWTRVSDKVLGVYQPQKDLVKVTNSRGTLGSGVGVSATVAGVPDEYLEMRASIGKDVWDDEFHEFRMDWYANRVEYYIDGVLLQTNTFCVPDIEGRFSFGLSFPSAPLSGKEWLPDPLQLSAGEATWHHQTMTVRNISYTPFTTAVAGGKARTLGETYPFSGCYEIK